MLNTVAPLPPCRDTSMPKGASLSSKWNCWLFCWLLALLLLLLLLAGAAGWTGPALLPAFCAPAAGLPAGWLVLSGPPPPPGSKEERKSQVGTSHRLLSASVSLMRKMDSVRGSADSLSDCGRDKRAWRWRVSRQLMVCHV